MSEEQVSDPYHVAHRRALQAMAQAYRNIELPNFTQALYRARELAMERMQYEAQQAKAEGVVGVQIIEKNHIWGHTPWSSSPWGRRSRATGRAGRWPLPGSS